MNAMQSVEQIVRELLQQMQAAADPQVQVLYVLDDSRAADAFMDQFVLLGKNGVKHDVLTLDGEASGWLGRQCIESTGARACIALNESAPAPIELPLAYDAIIIPDLDLDQATRIAMGLKGTVKSEVAIASLMLQKPLFTASDGCGIKRADRRTWQTLQLPAGYERRYQGVLQQLQELGVYTAPASQLAAQALKRLKPASPLAAIGEPDGDGSQMAYAGKLLTAEVAMRLLRESSSGALLVQRDTIVSPLARDVLKSHHIQLRIVDEVSQNVPR